MLWGLMAGLFVFCFLLECLWHRLTNANGDIPDPPSTEGCEVAHLFALAPAAHTAACAGELINVLREAKQKVPDALLSFGTTVKVRVG